MFDPKITFKNPYYYISGFNFHELRRYAGEFYLSTRMEEIETWSKDMFKAIIDNT